MSTAVHVFKLTGLAIVGASFMALIFPTLTYAISHEFWPEYAGLATLSVLLAMLAVMAAAWLQQRFGRLVFDERLGVIEQRGVSPFRLAFSAVKSVGVQVNLQSDYPPYGSIKIVGATGEVYRVREEFFCTTTQTIAIIQIVCNVFPGKVHET